LREHTGEALSQSPTRIYEPKEVGVSMRLTGYTLRAVSNRLYAVAACLYFLSLLSRTVLMAGAYTPELERFSRPLAGALKFLVQELQAFTPPAVATVCLVAAFICHPTLTRILDLQAEDD